MIEHLGLKFIILMAAVFTLCVVYVWMWLVGLRDQDKDTDEPQCRPEQ